MRFISASCKGSGAPRPASTDSITALNPSPGAQTVEMSERESWLRIQTDCAGQGRHTLLCRRKERADVAPRGRPARLNGRRLSSKLIQQMVRLFDVMPD